MPKTDKRPCDENWMVRARGFNIHQMLMNVEHINKLNLND